MSSIATIGGNVWDKIDALPLSFNFTQDDLIPCINDATREMGIVDLASVVPNSRTELFVEIRTVYYFLMRARMDSAVNFKYSTGSDGKTVDKTKIADTIRSIMSDLDEQFSKWGTSAGMTGRTWSRARRTSTTLQGV